MVRNHIQLHLQCAVASVAVLLFSAGAVAQSSPATSPGKDNAAAAAARPADKAMSGDKAASAGKTDPKAAAADPAAKEADRAARLKSQHDAERQQLAGALHAPMTDGQKKDLRQHAERVAKLERIRALALEAKDNATVDRANKLLDKENARYEKWITTLSTKIDTNESSKAKAGAQ
jgi:hypothetical protein